MTDDGGHLTPETLADAAEGLLPEAQHSAVRAHLETCAHCRAVATELRAVSALLASVAAPDMPADVAARLEAALRREAPGAPSTRPAATGPAATGPATGGRPAGPSARPPVAAAVPGRSSRPRLPAWVGAAALLLLGGTGAVIGFRALDGSDPSSSSGSAALEAADRAADAPSTTVVPSSGRVYTAATLEEQVQALLRDDDASDEEAAADGREAAPGTLPGSGDTAAAPSAPSGDPALGALAAPESLARCIQALTGRPGVTPLAVDLASFEDRPAAVIVLPDPDDATVIDVRVVGPGCSAGDDDVIVARRVPRR